MSIIRNAKFHVLCGYIHIFLSLAFVFTLMGRRVVLMVGGCCDVIITNPTCTYLVLHATLSHGVIVTIMT